MKGLVLAFGSFDILHPGHLAYLRKARRLGKILIVVVARDESMRRFKGVDPVFDEKERAIMVGSLKFVDKAVIGNRLLSLKDRYKIIKKYRPEVIAFGYDQRIDTGDLLRWLSDNGIRARIVRIRYPLRPSRYKSSKVKSAILGT